MKAVFLDKDGTLIEDVPYNVDPAEVRLTPGAEEGLFLLHAAGFKLFVVSNQSGVARGYFREDALAPVEARLRELLDRAEVPLSGFYYCPHHPEGRAPEYAVECDCRKPGPGLILEAALDHGIDLDQSWMVGDILNDIEAGRRAGCRTVLVDNGNETEWVLNPYRLPHHLAADLPEAALIIAAVGGIGPRLHYAGTGFVADDERLRSVAVGPGASDGLLTMDDEIPRTRIPTPIAYRPASVVGSTSHIVRRPSPAIVRRRGGYP
ncbi:MAG: D-glycero-alpha-D-manno-heptose-1,7-bisphosphate 7-phosphatase [Chloroflexia bacterium]